MCQRLRPFAEVIAFAIYSASAWLKSSRRDSPRQARGEPRMLRCAKRCRLRVTTPPPVEPEGFEPSSKRPHHVFSTCFFLHWFSEAGRGRTPYRQLRPCCLTAASGQSVGQHPRMNPWTGKEG